MAAREPCAGRANTAAKSRQTAEPRLQDIFVGRGTCLRDLLCAPRRRADSSRHDEYVSRIRSRAQTPAKSTAARPMGNRNVAPGRDDFHARTRRLARSTSVLLVVIPAIHENREAVERSRFIIRTAARTMNAMANPCWYESPQNLSGRPSARSGSKSSLNKP